LATASIPILLLTCGLALAKPKFGEFRVRQGAAGLLGGVLTLAVGAVSLEQFANTMRFLFAPVVTIVSLMTLTLVAEQTGLFRVMAAQIAQRAKGDGRKLFTYIFIIGTATGTVFTNDAAVLIFTPLVWRLIEDVAQDDWTEANKIPFYFGVLYVANLVGALLISNPINIVVANLFSISFADYAKWMILPAIASMLVTYAGLRLFFRRELPKSYALDRVVRGVATTPAQAKSQRVMGIILCLTLLAFFAANWIGLPFWKIAALAACIALIATAPLRVVCPRAVVRGVGWDVVLFMCGMFVIAVGLRNAGLTTLLQSALRTLGGASLSGLSFVAALLSGTMSSVINNHPTADMMGLTIRDMAFAAGPQVNKFLALSALIGGDLGPKMLPIGSLAAMMWFRLLADKGVRIRYRQYISMGIPLTLAAIVCSVLVLLAEVKFFGN
jgi:arsenical pump membrane protein